MTKFSNKNTIDSSIMSLPIVSLKTTLILSGLAFMTGLCLAFSIA